MTTVVGNNSEDALTLFHSTATPDQKDRECSEYLEEGEIKA